MNKHKSPSFYVFAISLISALGGFLFGYDWVVIGGAKPFYEQFFQIANIPHLQGWAVSCALIGCILGTVISGALSDRYGRKKLLIFSALLFLVSAIGTGAANSFAPFVLYRILGGIGIGLASNLSPMYIAEISPAHVRGKFVSLNQLTIVIGILAAQVANWVIADTMENEITGVEILNSWNGQMGWRWMFWAEAIPAVFFFGMMWMVPESPRWLARRHEHDKVNEILIKIGGEGYAAKAIVEIENSMKNEAEEVNFSALFKPGVVGVVIIGVVLAAFQQWCGINVIFMYADEIFAAAGYNVSDMLFNVIIIGSVNLLFTLLAMFTVDKIGRKKLMLAGSAGLAVIYSILGAFYYLGFQGWPMLVLVVLSIACYASTLAPITWVVLSEIFPNRIRGLAMAVATFSLWTASMLLTFFFPIINNAIQASGSFWLFAVICFSGFFFIKNKLVETKGKSLEEIQKELTD
ncbi:MAG: sugar porter family MFS transporter [Maribacter sp.]|nr:sugar porter family MFS transporter [Maribacter sp.]